MAQRPRKQSKNAVRKRASRAKPIQPAPLAASCDEAQTILEENDRNATLEETLSYVTYLTGALRSAGERLVAQGQCLELDSKLLMEATSGHPIDILLIVGNLQQGLEAMNNISDELDIYTAQFAVATTDLRNHAAMQSAVTPQLAAVLDSLCYYIQHTQSLVAGNFSLMRRQQHLTAQALEQALSFHEAYKTATEALIEDYAQMPVPETPYDAIVHMPADDNDSRPPMRAIFDITFPNDNENNARNSISQAEAEESTRRCFRNNEENTDCLFLFKQ